MNLAVLDLGSNSFHLAVFTSSDRAVLAPRRELRNAVQLGASLRDGHIDGAGFARGLLAVESLLRDLAALHPGCAVVAVATSAIRDAVNGRAFCEEVERRHGIAIDILSGREEARMAFLGARLFAGPAGRLAVVDLGGGSLEVASGPGADPDLADSIPIGVLRLRDVHMRAGSSLDPATRERVAAAVRFAAAEAARAVWNRHPERLAFTSGTARALGTLADELGIRDAGSGELTRAVLARLVQVLSQFRPVDLPALGVDESRSDTIAIGAVVLHTMMELLGFERALVSPLALREGVAIRELRRSRPRPHVHAAVT
jgi:exopolyphosphatase/guanosine-5'-triphosphate,3'-diphosphate pyrophosphatase